MGYDVSLLIDAMSAKGRLQAPQNKHNSFVQGSLY